MYSLIINLSVILLYFAISYSGGRDIKDLVSFIEGKSGKSHILFYATFWNLSVTRKRTIRLLERK